MKKKNILITGASRGIGHSTALHLASLGHNIAISCIHNKALLDDLAKNVNSLGVKACTFQGDMGDYEAADAFYKKAVSELGSIDVIINNAGISYVGLLQDMKPDEWNRIFTTNVTAVYNMCHIAIPDMVQHKAGKIINISSMWGICGASCETAYSATKGAINAFTRSLGKELAPSGISVNAIACGAIMTDMNGCFSQDELTSLANDIPAGRLGTPLEVAKMIQLLLEAPDYLTGEVIKMDGGFI